VRVADKPKQFSNAYASIFQDASVAAAYENRSAYPDEILRMLQSLIPANAAQRIALQAGSGNGFIARFVEWYVASRILWGVPCNVAV
jgi:hypothetical protein